MSVMYKSRDRKKKIPQECTLTWQGMEAAHAMIVTGNTSIPSGSLKNKGGGQGEEKKKGERSTTSILESHRKLCS